MNYKEVPHLTSKATNTTTQPRTHTRIRVVPIINGKTDERLRREAKEKGAEKGEERKGEGEGKDGKEREDTSMDPAWSC